MPRPRQSLSPYAEQRVLTFTEKHTKPVAGHAIPLKELHQRFVHSLPPDLRYEWTSSDVAKVLREAHYVLGPWLANKTHVANIAWREQHPSPTTPLISYKGRLRRQIL